MSGSALTFEAAQADAAARGLVIRLPAANELFVDIDTAADFKLFHHLLSILEEYEPVLGYEVTPSASGGDHKHVIVRLARDVASDDERVLLQAVLGSDRVRELLSFARIRSKAREHPVLFFEKPPPGTLGCAEAPSGVEDPFA